jgi:hypothetical protein
VFSLAHQATGGCYASTVKPFQVALVKPVVYLKTELISETSDFSLKESIAPPIFSFNHPGDPSALPIKETLLHFGRKNTLSRLWQAMIEIVIQGLVFLAERDHIFNHPIRGLFFDQHASHEPGDDVHFPFPHTISRDLDGAHA